MSAGWTLKWFVFLDKQRNGFDFKRELVYENYNKFLMATQVRICQYSIFPLECFLNTKAVRNMQDRLASMRTNVAVLSKTMSNISTLTDNITQV